MGFLEFIFGRDDASKHRRRRSPSGPFEGIKADTTAKPVPRLRTLGPITDMHSPTAPLKMPSDSSTAADPRADNDPTGALVSRHHHLTHVALRSAAFEKPNYVRKMLASEEAKSFLSRLAASYPSQQAESTSPSAFAVDDIRLHQVRIGRFACTIVEMPPPQEASEAYFVGILQTTDSHNPPHSALGDDLRYFMLEKGTGDAAVEPTVFCEWTKFGGWRSLGEGPPPQLEPFVQAISRAMR